MSPFLHRAKEVNALAKRIRSLSTAEVSAIQQVQDMAPGLVLMSTDAFQRACTKVYATYGANPGRTALDAVNERAEDLRWQMRRRKVLLPYSLDFTVRRILVSGLCGDLDAAAAELLRFDLDLALQSPEWLRDPDIKELAPALVAHLGGSAFEVLSQLEASGDPWVYDPLWRAYFTSSLENVGFDDALASVLELSA